MMISSKDNLLRVIHHQEPQWVPNGMESVVTIVPPVVERPERAGLDAFGVCWAYEAHAQGGTFPAQGGHTISDLGRWREQLELPDLDTLDWTGVCDQVDSVDRATHLISGFVEMGLFERCYLLLGMEESLMAFMSQPEDMLDLIGAIADYKIALIARFDDVVGLDMVWFGDDWGTQSGLFLPPRVWRQTIRPHLKRIYDCMIERDILINQHSCGRIEAVFGDIVEMGAHVWNPCQPCNDLVELKRQFGGRITFCGGIDSQFVLDRPGVTTDEVRAEVRLRIDQLSEGGGYIAAPSHTVPYEQDLIDAMNDEIASYGRAVYA